MRQTQRGVSGAYQTAADVLEELSALAPRGTVAAGDAIIAAPKLHALAKRIGRNHDIARALWESGRHSARLLAGLVGDPKRLTETEMEAWVVAIDAWDICDGLCCYLFDRTPWAYAKAVEWSARPEEFVKRAGFALMAYLSVHDKRAADDRFLAWLPIVARESTDSRHFVKNAVNWALRQIGKRNLSLNRAAIVASEEIRKIDSPTARWVATDARRELTGAAVQRRLMAPRKSTNSARPGKS